jgi:NADPH:quinone reductase-like Zn-dependent oxidoreductase
MFCIGNAALADSGAGRSGRANARRADQSSGPEPDRRKISGPAQLPATPGFEGAGWLSILARTSKTSRGCLSVVPHNLGTWRDAVVVKASELVAVPPDIDPVHAAMLKINPMTAWRLLHDYVDLKSGDWLIQNAANSAAGRAVIQIARELGFRTVNVVRPRRIDRCTCAPKWRCRACRWRKSS